GGTRPGGTCAGPGRRSARACPSSSPCGPGYRPRCPNTTHPIVQATLLCGQVSNMSLMCIFVLIHKTLSRRWSHVRSIKAPGEKESGDGDRARGEAGGKVKAAALGLGLLGALGLPTSGRWLPALAVGFGVGALAHGRQVTTDLFALHILLYC